MLDEVIVRWGMIAVFIFMISNGFISTPPSEIVLSIAGALTIGRNLYFGYMLLGAVISNYLGTLILFYISKRKGKIWYDKLRAMKIVQNNKTLCKIIPSSDRLISFFNRQEWMVFACRFIPFIRSIISVPAGISKMSLSKFTFFSLAGIGIWCFGWLEVGRTIASEMDQGNNYIICIFFILFALSGVVGNIVQKK